MRKRKLILERVQGTISKRRDDHFTSVQHAVLGSWINAGRCLALQAAEQVAAKEFMDKPFRLYGSNAVFAMMASEDFANSWTLPSEASIDDFYTGFTVGDCSVIIGSCGDGDEK